MDNNAAHPGWESELAGLLAELSHTQTDVLELLAQKRALLVSADAAGLAALEPREEAIIARLQACQQRRAGLLARATEEGRPNENLRSLARSLPRSEREQLSQQLQEASSRARLLQHHSLTNWVIVQRTLIHLAQVLEIIATGGRTEPTYGKGAPSPTSGSLVNQAA